MLLSEFRKLNRCKIAFIISASFSIDHSPHENFIVNVLVAIGIILTDVIVNIHYMFIFYSCVAISDAAEELTFAC